MSESLAVVAKRELRARVRQTLIGMSSDDRRRQSEDVFRAVVAHKRYVESKRIALYVSLAREVNTRALIEHSLNAGKHVFVPKYERESRRMDFLELFSMADLNALPRTQWGIQQPRDGRGRKEALSSGGVDLMVVPALAFTADGRRLGNGNGYYDCYLRKCVDSGQRPFVLGVAFAQQMLDSIPTECHDFLLDSVVFST